MTWNNRAKAGYIQQLWQGHRLQDICIKDNTDFTINNTDSATSLEAVYLTDQTYYLKPISQKYTFLLL
jgi:hypothetical protein